MSIRDTGTKRAVNLFDPARVAAIIPALNEERSLPPVLETLRRVGLGLIVVADNGSTDRTAEIAVANGAQVVHAPVRGYGAACAAALASLPPDAKWILFVDADSAKELEALPALFDAAARGADFILGDRTATPEARAALTPVQRFGNTLATSILRIVHGHHYNDLGPLRLIRRTALDRIGMRDRGFGWTVEMQARAVDRGLRIAEIPIERGGRTAGASKVSGTLRGAWGAGRAILATLVLCIVQRVREGAAACAGVQHALAATALAGLAGGAWIMMPHGDFTGNAAHIPPFLRGATLMGLGFACAGLLVRMPLWLFWCGALLPRLLLLPMTPGDDVWRYLWEGAIQWQGINPYLIPPDAAVLEPLRTEWWHRINNGASTAIYPPLTLLTFAALSVLGGGVLLFKSAFTLADLAVCALLVQRFGSHRAAAYAWSPLVIYSFAGGAHYDSFMILAMTLALLARPGDGPSRRAAFWNGVAAAFKYLTLPIAAHEARSAFLQGRWRETFLCAAVAALPVALGALWFHDAFLHGRFYPEKFATYARSAEFLRFHFEWPHPWWQHNTLIRGLVAAAIGMALVFATRCRAIFAERWLIVLLACSPLVHAWYFAWLAPFAAITGNIGAALAGVFAFAYFQLHWHAGQQGGLWELSHMEHALLWGPVLGGYVFSLFLRVPRGEPVVTGSDWGTLNDGQKSEGAKDRD